MFRLRVSGGPRAGEVFPLDAARPCQVGRGSESAVRFAEDPYMSRAHAQLLLVDGAWVVRNLSPNGLLVSGQVVQGDRPLKPSDVLLIGRTLLLFELVDPTVRRPTAFPQSTTAGPAIVAPAAAPPALAPAPSALAPVPPALAPVPVSAAAAPPPAAPEPAIAAAAAPVAIPQTVFSPPAVIPPTVESAPASGGAGVATPAAVTPAAASAAANDDSMSSTSFSPVVFLPGDSRELTAAELAGFELFKGVPEKTIEGSIIKRHKINDQPPIWLRSYQPGEVICREGEYGSTAFFITRGTVFIGIDAARDESAVRGGVLSRLMRKLFGRGVDESADDDDDMAEADSALSGGAQRLIPLDAPVHLHYDLPVGELKEGDIFGEMSCMSFYPRSATCVAGPDGVECLEILRSVLDFIRTNAKAAYKERIERNYRERTLDLALRNIPMFSNLPAGTLDAIRPLIDLATYAPDQPIFEEGAAADAFYLIRLGFVKLSQRRPGGDVVLKYLGPGQHFGEVGLITGGTRLATASALDNVELIRITRENWAALSKQFPAFSKAVERSAEAVVSERAQKVPARQELPLGILLEKGVMNAQNLLVIDLEKCTRCDECVKGCADSHGGVTRLIRDGLRIDKYLVATACRACTDPVCMIGCPVGSIRRRNSMEITIEDWCIGCGKCAQQCPYGNISMHPYQKSQKVVEEKDGKKVKRRELVVVNQGKGRAVSCDLCHEDGEPRCVYSCPHGAARRGSPLDLFASALTTGDE